MLKAKYRELVSAYLDGELTPPEKAEALRLIADNPEAGQLHAAFSAIRGSIREAALETPIINVHSAVLARLNSVRPAVKPLPSRRNAFLWSGVAASLFAIVGLASFNVFFNPKHDTLANRNKSVNTAILPPSPLTVIEEGDVPSRVVIQPKLPDNKQAVELAEVLPPPRPAHSGEGIVTAPAKPDFDIVRTESNGRLSLLMSLRDLEKDTANQKLKAELGKDDIIRIDLFCRDLAKSQEQLTAALKSKGLTGHIDGNIAERLKRKNLGEIIFFSETLSTQEMASLLQQLSKDDANRAAKNKDDALFSSLVVIPHQSADVDRLSRSIGVPMNQLKLPRKAAVLDPKQSLEANTASKLAQGLKPGRNQFVAVPYYYGEKGAAAPGKEVKLFMEQRGEAKANAKPLILILRQS